MKAKLGSVRMQQLLLVVVTCALFTFALVGSLWQLQSGQQRLLGFVNHELAAERDLTQAYAQGLQMGQALRNILLDPANAQGYKNFDAARESFASVLAKLKERQDVLSAGTRTLEQLNDIHKRWVPEQDRVLALIRSGDSTRAQASLISNETPRWREMRGLLRTEAEALEARASAVNQEVVDGLDAAYRFAVVIAAVALLACIGLSLLFMRRLFRQLGGEPAVALQAAQRIANGDLENRIVLREQDDTSLMAALEKVRLSVRAMTGDVRALSDAAVAGKLSTRADATKH